MPREPFQKGKSRNPAGRPVGIPDRRTELRMALAAELPAIVEQLVAKAKAGDIAAASLLLSRCLPPMRAQSERVELPGLASATTLTEQAQAVIAAVGAGIIAPDAAGELLGALAALGRITEVDELAKRLAVIEGERDAS